MAASVDLNPELYEARGGPVDNPYVRNGDQGRINKRKVAKKGTGSMDGDGYELVKQFNKMPENQRQHIRALLRLPDDERERALARAFQQKASPPELKPPLSPSLEPPNISRIPRWQGRRVHGPALAYLEQHYGQWLTCFGAPEDRIYQDQIRAHDRSLVKGVDNELREKASGRKIRDYIPTRSARVDEELARSSVEGLLKNRRLVRALAARQSRGTVQHSSTPTF